jgi:hypothetical protein
MIDAVERAARLVAAWKKPAAIIGGICVVARVRPRLTRDVDLVITVGPDEVAALLELARREGYDFDEKETRELIQGGLARLWTPPGRTGGVALDLLFVDSPFLAGLTTRATLLELGAATAPVATTEDLLILKLEAHRPHDIDDILAIKDIVDDRFDLGRVREEATRMGALDRFELYFGARG